MKGKIQELADTILNGGVVTFEQEKPFHPLIVTLHMGMGKKTTRAKGSIIYYGAFARKVKLSYENAHTYLQIKIYSLDMELRYSKIHKFMQEAVKILKGEDNERL